MEDLIDNTFISEERLEKESVIYKILTGNFKDPFKNIEEDYKAVEIDLMKDADPDLNKIKKECDVKSKQVKRINHYVPGSFKPIFKFPKKSKLNKEQQAMCLRVLLRFSKSDKPKLTQTEREEVQKYMVFIKNYLLLIKKYKYNYVYKYSFKILFTIYKYMYYYVHYYRSYNK